MSTDILNTQKEDQKLAEITDALSKASISNDQQALAGLSTRFKKQQELVSTLKNRDSLLAKISQARELVESGDELAEMAAEELSTLEEDLEIVAQKLENLTLPSFNDDDKNAIFEIRAGTGGTEASFFAEEINRMYVRYVNDLGMTIEQLSTSYNDEGGIKESIFVVRGGEAYGKLRFESGVHRVQRVPTTESGGRIHTSAISVVVLPEIEETEVEIEEKDIRIDVFRSSGPGGQSVNTTDSAVRITHIPSGIVVSCQDGKSQHQNRQKALTILASKLHAIQEAEREDSEKGIREQAIKSGDRSVKIRTYNFPQGRVTDHRVNQTWYNLPQIMEGDLSEVVPVVNKLLRQQIATDRHE